jgi:hypothetical protein
MNPSPAWRGLLGAAALAAAAAAPAQTLHYACSVAVHFEPGGCRGSISQSTDTVPLDVDLDHHLWRLADGSLDGPAEISDGGIVLQRWGGRDGRDAHIDRGSGAFTYQVKSDCLVETQAGSCSVVNR